MAASSAVTLKDVTKDFEQLCGMLGKGEMVQAQGFELSKAISAVELFSNKMDAGMISKRPQPADRNDLPFEAISVDQMIAIIDRLWNLEIAMYEGAPFSQSIMTCLYTHEPLFLKAKEQNPLLYAFLAATLRTSHRTALIVAEAGVCFEEDFYIASQGLKNLGQHLEDAEVSALLLEQIATVQDDRLAARLLFRMAFMDASRAFDAFNFVDAEKYLHQGVNELARIKFGKVDMTSADFAFDPQVNHWLIAPQPPRPEVVFSAPNVFVKWHNLVENLLYVCQARKSVTNGSMRGELISLYEELCRFSRMRRNINALARSRMFYALCDKDKRAFGLAPWKTLVAKDVALWGPDATSSFMEDGVGTGHGAMQLLFEVFRVLCTNPARQRRRLVHRIEEFGSFQQRCEVVDAKRMNLTSFNDMDVRQRQQLREQFVLPLGSWACEWCVRLMIRFLELGSELELYRPREAKSLVYYLFFINRLAADFHTASVKARGLSGEWDVSPKHPMVSSLRRTVAMNEVRKTVSLGNLQLLAALTSYESGEAKDPKAVFDFPRLHFEHRFFDPFSTVWLPQAISYADVFAAFKPGQTMPVHVMLDRCEESYKTAKMLCAELAKRPEFVAEPRAAEDLKDLLRTVVKNLLACATVKTLTKGTDKVQYAAVFDPSGYATLMTFAVEKVAPIATALE